MWPRLACSALLALGLASAASPPQPTESWVAHAGAPAHRASISGVTVASACPVGALLCEDFEDTDFAARGWYDGSGGVLSATEHAPGCGHALECTYPAGGPAPAHVSASEPARGGPVTAPGSREGRA